MTQSTPYSIKEAARDAARTLMIQEGTEAKARASAEDRRRLLVAAFVTLRDMERQGR